MRNPSLIMQRRTYDRDGKRRRGGGVSVFRRYLRGVQITQLVRAPVRTVRWTTPLDDLCTIFINDDVDVVAVLDDEGTFRGTVSRASLIRYSIERCDALPHRPCRFPTCPLVDTNVQVSLWTMKKSVPTDPKLPLPTAGDLMDTFRGSIGPEASVGQAVALMVFAGIQVLPIIDQREGRLEGLITTTDVLRWIAGASGYLRASRPRRWR